MDSTGYNIYLTTEKSLLWLTVNNQLQFKYSGCLDSKGYLSDKSVTELKVYDGKVYAQMKDSNDLVIYDHNLHLIKKKLGLIQKLSENFFTRC